MPGVSHFDLFPKDWLGDTRELSEGERGVYIDLLCRMYSIGGPIPYSEDTPGTLEDLRSLLAFKSVRKVKSYIGALIQHGKLRLVDGYLVNGRTMEELARIQARIEAGRKGGRASKKGRAESPQNEVLPQTSSKLGQNFEQTLTKLDTRIDKKQRDNSKHFPVPGSRFPKQKASSTEKALSEDEISHLDRALSGLIELGLSEHAAKPFVQSLVTESTAAHIYAVVERCLEKRADGKKIRDLRGLIRHLLRDTEPPPEKRSVIDVTRLREPVEGL